jgi:hypothetical protein
MRFSTSYLLSLSIFSLVGCESSLRPFRPSQALESSQEALAVYPALGVAGSRFNQRFLEIYGRQLDAKADLLMKENWPMEIAVQVAAEMKVKPEDSKNTFSSASPLNDPPKRVKFRWTDR